MKKLILVRHAKSDWGNESLRDIDRHLNERGYDDAYRMHGLLKEGFGMPDLLVSSPATRAISTAFIFARGLGIPESRVQVTGDIYEAKADQLLKVISQFDNAKLTAVLFGHNPGLTNLVNELNSDLMFDNIPTCGMVCIGFEFSAWKDILSSKEGKLLGYKFPKSFKQD